MSNQAQCPNCGGFKVNSRKGPLTETVRISWPERLIKSGCGFALTGGLIVGLLATRSMNNRELSCILGFLAFILLAASFVVLFSNIREKVVGRGYSYVCLLCGYRWEVPEGEPWPDVQVKPELIALGARRLEEEAEERRRQEEEERQRQEEENRRRKREKEERERRELEKRMRDSGMF